jgi:protein-disulfide isomerase/uncharacterized membrane protein
MPLGIGKKRQRIPAPEKEPYFLSSWPFVVILCLALVGVFATGFLTYRHIALTAEIATVGESFLCSASGRINCDAILLTEYAVLFGFISSAALGLTGFVFVVWISILALIRQGLRKIALAALVIYFFGAIGFSWYYLYLMAFKVNNICTWCIVAHVVNFICLILVLVLAVKKRKDFLLEEIASYTEQACYILAGAFLALATFFGAMAIEYKLSFNTARADYEAIANDPVVILAMVVNSPTHDVKISPDDPVLGDRNAPLPIFFFSDYQCSVCAKSHAYYKELVRLNPGKLCLVFKNYPLSNKCNWASLEQGGYHPQSCLAARAAHAVYILGGLQKFLAYGNMLYANQHDLTQELMVDYAKKMGLDIARFKEMILEEDSPAYKKVREDIESGIEIRIVGTPTVIFLGKKLPLDYQGEALISLMEQLTRGERPDMPAFELRRPPPGLLNRAN